MRGARGIESLGQMGAQLTSEVELLVLGCCGVRGGVDDAFGSGFWDGICHGWWSWCYDGNDALLRGSPALTR